MMDDDTGCIYPDFVLSLLSELTENGFKIDKGNVKSLLNLKKI